MVQQQNPMGAAVAAGARPSWRGLRAGGEKTPLKEFIGQFSTWRTENDNFGKTNVILHYGKMQVLDSEAPYPHTEGELTIKLSDQQNSGWGLLGANFAKAHNIAIDQMDLDSMIGEYHHMRRIDGHQFFVDKDGKPAVGSIWDCVQYSKVPFAGQMGQHTMATSVTPTNSTTPVTVTGVKTPEQRALELLNGNDLSTFFQLALTDTEVQKDSNLVTQIINRQFVASKIQAGVVVALPDGRHAVAKI